MILNYLKELFTKYKVYILMGVIILGLLFMLGRTVSEYRNYRKISTNNIEALTDSISYYQGKNGELVAEKTILLGDKKTLAETNEELSKSLKSMKVKNAEQAVQIKGLMENQPRDTTWILSTDTLMVYPSFKKDFDFSNKYQMLSGNVFLQNNQLGLNIEKNTVMFDYTVAIKDSKVFITSSNPYVKYTEITGITIPQYKPKWSFVVGPSVTTGYDPINKTWGVMVGASATFGYNIANIGRRAK